MANLSFQIVGTMWEALQRLVALDNDNWGKLTTYFQRIVNEPAYRRQVYLAMSGELTVPEMDKEEWVEREVAVLSRLAEFGLSQPDKGRIAAAWRSGFSIHHRYLPKGPGMRKLLDVCDKAGIKLYSKSIPSGGEEPPTEEGVLECGLEKIMAPTNRNHYPFLLDFDGQVEWAKAEGGDGLTSVEETLYLLLRALVELERIPFMGGWIRCRNQFGSDGSLGVGWFADDGLGVSSDSCGHRLWHFGAVSRKFIKLGN